MGWINANIIKLHYFENLLKQLETPVLFFNYTTKTKRMSAQIPQTRTTPASVTLLFHEGGR